VKLDPQPILVGKGVNDGYWVVDQDDASALGWFKFPSAHQHASPYSIAADWIASRLAAGIGLPVPEAYLETIGGENGLVSRRLTGIKWKDADDDTQRRTRLLNRDAVPVLMAFDVLVACPDRHGGNVWLQFEPPAAQQSPDDRRGVIWFFDYGHSCLWPPWKLDDRLRATDLESIPANAQWTAQALAEFRQLLPPQLRTAWVTADRAEVLDEIRRISEDDIETAVASVSTDYLTSRAADVTKDFLIDRLRSIDTLVGEVFPP
jgi:hypothetical protein